MKIYGVNPVLRLLTLPCANEIDFNVADEPSCFPFNFEHVTEKILQVFEDPRRSALTHPAFHVRYQDE